MNRVNILLIALLGLSWLNAHLRFVVWEDGWQDEIGRPYRRESTGFHTVVRRVDGPGRSSVSTTDSTLWNHRTTGFLLRGDDSGVRGAYHGDFRIGWDQATEKPEVSAASPTGDDDLPLTRPASLETLNAVRDRLLADAVRLDPQNRHGDLSRACNIAGDTYQLRDRFEPAIALFRKAIASGGDPEAAAYAHVSIAACLLSEGRLSPGGRNENVVSELKAALVIPECAPDIRQDTVVLLQQIQSGNTPP